jgi:predicted TIM-barrel fold metal-dependent hydrolase
MQGETVVDVDAHYIDHLDDILDYFDDDDPWKEKFVHGHERDARSNTTSFFPTSSSNESPRVHRRSRMETKEDVLGVMDEIGIDKILLIGQQMLRMGNMRADDKRPIKYTEAYMRYVLDAIADPSEGIYVTIPIVHTDPDAAVRILETFGDEKAVAGVVFVSSGGDRLPFGNRRFDPVYEACTKFDLPVIFHAEGGNIDDPYLSGFGTTLETHTLGFLLSNMKQITSIVIQGVPEKFPDLDFLFQEAGIFYVPALMYRMDQEYLRNPDDAPLLDKLPSEYMKEFYYGTQPLEQPPKEEYVEYVVEMLGGPDRLMWASDWPHPDYDRTNAIEDLRFLSRDEKADVLGSNAERVFDF